MEHPINRAKCIYERKLLICQDVILVELLAVLQGLGKRQLLLHQVRLDEKSQVIDVTQIEVLQPPLERVRCQHLRQLELIARVADDYLSRLDAELLDESGHFSGLLDDFRVKNCLHIIFIDDSRQFNVDELVHLLEGLLHFLFLDLFKDGLLLFIHAQSNNVFQHLLPQREFEWLQRNLNTDELLADDMVICENTLEQIVVLMTVRLLEAVRLDETYFTSGQVF